MKQPYGIIPAMLSVFNKDGSVDVKGQKAYAEWLIKKGVHGLSPVGSTGEGAAMNDPERLQIIKATVEQAAGRVPVYAGIIHYSTKLAIDLAKGAMDAGCDGLMVLLPYYYKPTIPDAVDHLRAVSKAIKQPIMVYNNPWFAGFELSPALVKQLADEGVVNSIKAAHGDPMRVNYIKYLCGDKVSALYGHDYAPLEAFSVGGDGVVVRSAEYHPGFGGRAIQRRDEGQGSRQSAEDLEATSSPSPTTSCTSASATTRLRIGWQYSRKACA